MKGIYRQRAQPSTLFGNGPASLNYPRAVATPALYRRYRPESFAEVIGQDHVTEPLRRALRAQRVGHAYLFSGPRGCGKTTSARILARCLNCAEGPTDAPCGVCDSCRDLARDGAGSLDVVEIDAASHGGVDDARELRERASFAPVRDRYKVFIIDEAHMVTSAGFNALLKLVEEPPEHVKFIFATTEPDKVIGTIRSRTHHYPFRLIPPQILLPYVSELARQENVQVAEGVLPLVVRAGGGSARDTLSVLDQLMAGAGDDGVDLELAANLLGFTDVALLNRSVAAIAERDAQELFTAVNEVIGSGHEPRAFVEDLLERFRDLIVVTAAPETAAELLPEVPVDQLEELMREAQQFQPRELTVCAEIIAATLDSMTGATAPRLHLELLAAKIMLRDEQAPHTAPGVQPAPMPSGTSPEADAAGQGTPADGARSQGGSSARERAMQVARAQAEAARARRAQLGDAIPTAAPQQNAAPAPQQSAAPESPQSAAPAPQQVAKPVGQDSLPEEPAPQESAPAPTEQKPAPTPQQPEEQERAPIPQRSDESAPAPQQAEEPATGGITVQQVEENWSALMDALQSIRRPSWALIAQNAAVHSVTGPQLVLGFRSQGLVNAFYRGTAAANMAEAVHRILRAEVTVEAVAGDGDSADPQPPEPRQQSVRQEQAAQQQLAQQQTGQQPAAQPQAAQLQTAEKPAGASSDPWGDIVVVQPPTEDAAAQSPTEDAAAQPPAEVAAAQPPAEVAAAQPPAEDAPASHHAPATHPVEEAPAEPSADDVARQSPTPEASAAGRPAPANAENWAAALAPQRAAASPASQEWDGASADDEPPFDPYHDAFPDDGGHRHQTRTEDPPAPASPPAMSPVSLPPQPGEDQPRTHGQGELVAAMRAAYGEDFSPSATLIAAPNPAETNSTSAPAGAPPAPAGAPPAPAAAPSKDRPMSGADLARAAARQGRAAARGEPGSASGFGANAAGYASGGSSGAPAAPAAEDPFGGASRDDEDATGTIPSRRPGRDIVKEVLGGEILEVIDETGDQ